MLITGRAQNLLSVSLFVILCGSLWNIALAHERQHIQSETHISVAAVQEGLPVAAVQEGLESFDFSKQSYKQMYAGLSSPGFYGFANLGYNCSGYHLGSHSYEKAISNGKAIGCGGNMAREVAKAAGIGRDDVVVDVGCGNGIQDFLLMSEFKPKHITAYNFDDAQIARADDVANKIWPDEIRNRVTFLVGDAVDLPRAANSASKVFSIESAMQYHTREMFMHEAFRILQSGGVLCLADHVPTQGDHGFPGGKGYDAIIRPENRYDIDAYIAKLRSTGFVNVGVLDVSSFVNVWPNEGVLPKTGYEEFAFVAYSHMSYYIITATKP